MVEIINIFARAGGGGSGGGGGAVGIILLPIIVIGIVVSRWIRRKRILKAKANQLRAQSRDTSWSNDVIKNRATEVFYAFQNDWSQFNVQNMQTYLTPRYYNHINTMLSALYQMGRRNEMKDVQLGSVTLFDVNDNEFDELDRFSVEIIATATDNLIDENTGVILHSDSPAFEEIWHFEREGTEWMLDSITQVNRSDIIVKYEAVVNEKYTNFALTNNFFYNADFGWLLMPHHGILFNQAGFGRSDINHHVIGVYHDIIVQFFEYIPLVEEKARLRDHLRGFYKPRSPFATYTIAHTTLPRDYSNIIVERRGMTAFFSFTPQGMTKVSLEWPQFNKLFDVFASDIDKVNSLELLHPAFMEQLVGLPFRVNIEIVGNDLYLYTADKKADYQQMLDVLKKSFEEMKM